MALQEALAEATISDVATVCVPGHGEVTLTGDAQLSSTAIISNSNPNPPFLTRTLTHALYTS